MFTCNFFNLKGGAVVGTILGTWKEFSEPMVAVVMLRNQTYC